MSKVSENACDMMGTHTCLNNPVLLNPLQLCAGFLYMWYDILWKWHNLHIRTLKLQLRGYVAIHLINTVLVCMYVRIYTCWFSWRPMFPDVGMATTNNTPRVSQGWQILTWVVAMSWNTSLCSWTFSICWFFLAAYTYYTTAYYSIHLKWNGFPRYGSVQNYIRLSPVPLWGHTKPTSTCIYKG